MLHFYIGLFGPLFAASVATIFEAVISYASAGNTQRSLVYVAEALLLNLVILDDMVDTTDAYEHATKVDPGVLYLEVLLFFLYVGAVLSIQPNQKALHINVPLLEKDFRKRQTFWGFLAMVALVGFLWSLVFQGFQPVFLTIFVFLALCIGGIFVEMTESERNSTILTTVVLVLTVAWIVLKRTHVIHV